MYVPIFYQHSAYVSRKSKITSSAKLELNLFIISSPKVLSNKWAIAYVFLYVSVVYGHQL